MRCCSAGEEEGTNTHIHTADAFRSTNFHTHTVTAQNIGPLENVCWVRKGYLLGVVGPGTMFAAAQYLVLIRYTHLSVVVGHVGVPELVVPVLVLLREHAREGLRKYHDQETDRALDVSYLHAEPCCCSENSAVPL